MNNTFFKLIKQKRIGIPVDIYSTPTDYEVTVKEINEVIDITAIHKNNFSAPKILFLNSNIGILRNNSCDIYMTDIEEYVNVINEAQIVIKQISQNYMELTSTLKNSQQLIDINSDSYIKE